HISEDKVGETGHRMTKIEKRSVDDDQAGYEAEDRTPRKAGREKVICGTPSSGDAHENNDSGTDAEEATQEYSEGGKHRRYQRGQFEQGDRPERHQRSANQEREHGTP